MNFIFFKQFIEKYFQACVITMKANWNISSNVSN